MNKDATGWLSCTNQHPETEIDEWIPLYTAEQLHPVKELNEEFEKGFKAGKEEGWKAHKFHHPVKELTDEEIIELTPFKKHPYDEFVEYEKEDLIDFAKAILRKAQEK